MRQKPCIVFITTIVLLATGLCPAADTLPFKPGEKLHYSVYLEEFSLGEVVFYVKPMEKIMTIPAYHFVMTSKTSPLLDSLFMLADRVDSYTDSALKHALLYKERHGSAGELDSTVTFDWKKREAHYSLGKKKYRPTPLLPGAFDPLSVLYALRLLDLKGKREVAKPVSDGLHCAVARAKVLGEQKVRAPSGTYDTYLLQPQLAEFSAVFKNISAAMVKIWISADARRLPVRITCEFPVGSLMAELTAVESR
ncbi:MAG: DUF3108 domain-containing protein [Deltaproteobacteria bacterium]|nr:DUF3108 domain-containing protein [Deltaproteobacteria bacterium]